MRSNDLLLNKYDSDKIEYLKYYDPIFEPWLEKRVDILELGIFKGGSLLLWKDYFPKGNIVGVDINLPTNFPPIDRIRIFKGYQDDPAFLTSVANQTAPYGYDFIIDDASHIGELSKKSFWYLFDNHLKPGGIYAIEDWGTGYWNEWPDGSPLDITSEYSQTKQVSKDPFPCHSYGMVGFIKQLIDEQGASDVTKYDLHRRKSKFEHMIITPYIVFVKKESNRKNYF
jgi:hypothetical protein